MGHDPLKFTTYTVNYYSVGLAEAVQLTSENFLSVQDWLEENGATAHLWTNESYVVGLWVHNTWHDRSDKTPVPFGWWVYRTADDGSIGCGSEISVEGHWDKGR